MWYLLVVWAVELEFYVLKTHTTPYPQSTTRASDPVGIRFCAEDLTGCHPGGAGPPAAADHSVCVVKSREGRQKLGHLGLEHPFRPLNILRQAQVCFAQLSFNTVRRQQAGAQLTDEKLLDRAAAEACQLLLGLGDSRGGLGASGVRLR